MHIPDVVVIPPAARSKHLFDDFTKKTMQSGLSNPSVDEGDSNCDDCKGRPYAKYFQNGNFFLDLSQAIIGMMIKGKSFITLNMMTATKKTC